MRVTHRFTIIARCPVDGRRDEYQCRVRADRTVPVEKILAAADRATTEPAFQEVITERMAADLGCRVETVGTHSGVKTRVVSGEPEDISERGKR